MRLYQITSSYFCAGIVVNDAGYCVGAAPIVHYMKGKSGNWIASYIKKKGWNVVKVESGKEQPRREPKKKKPHPWTTTQFELDPVPREAWDVYVDCQENMTEEARPTILSGGLSESIWQKMKNLGRW